MEIVKDQVRVLLLSSFFIQRDPDVFTGLGAILFVFSNIIDASPY